MRPRSIQPEVPEKVGSPIPLDFQPLVNARKAKSVHDSLCVPMCIL